MLAICGQINDFGFDFALFKSCNRLAIVALIEGCQPFGSKLRCPLFMGFLFPPFPQIFVLPLLRGHLGIFNAQLGMSVKIIMGTFRLCASVCLTAPICVLCLIQLFGILAAIFLIACIEFLPLFYHVTFIILVLPLCFSTFRKDRAHLWLGHSGTHFCSVLFCLANSATFRDNIRAVKRAMDLAAVHLQVVLF